MRFWLREIAGWVTVALGLFAFYVSFVLLLSQHILEAGPMTFMGVILFRGGIHLLKVAVAARICVQAQEAVDRDRLASRPATPAPANSRPLTGIGAPRVAATPRPRL